MCKLLMFDLSIIHNSEIANLWRQKFTTPHCYGIESKMVFCNPHVEGPYNIYID